MVASQDHDRRAGVASGILAMVGTTLVGVLMPFLTDPRRAAAPRTVATRPTTATPAVYIGKPLSVRPVVQALVATPRAVPAGSTASAAPAGRAIAHVRRRAKGRSINSAQSRCS